MTRPARPWLYAHRGASAEFPENTLAAFQRAVDLGVDALEMDVHRTSDGQLVVAHDDTGLRMAGIPNAIRETPFAELRKWDVGFGFTRNGERPHAGKGMQIPLFAEVLEAFPKLRFNVDIKPADPQLADLVLRTVADHKAHQRVLLTSFYASNVDYVRSRGYKGPTGLARDEVLSALARPAGMGWTARGNAAQIPYQLGPVPLGIPGVINHLHRYGLRVDFWVVNDPAVAEKLLNAGADGIMTDDPAAIAPVVERHRGRSA